MKHTITTEINDCTILYTTTDGKKINIDKDTFATKIVSHTYKEEGTIVFNKPITKIPAYAFSRCDTLAKITIPESVKVFYASSFEECTNLQEYNHSYTSADKRCLIVNGVLKTFAPAGLTEYTIPGGVTKIGNGVFRGAKLKKVVIPEGVNVIASCAFQYCEELCEVVIHNGVTEIGQSAFSNCAKLKSITIPNSVTKVGDWAFVGCKSLLEFNSPLATADKRCLLIDGALVAFAPAGLTDYTFPPEFIEYKKSIFDYNTEYERMKIAFEQRKSKVKSYVVSKEKRHCEWIEAGKDIQVHGLTLSRGNFYLGNYFETQEEIANKYKCPSISQKIYSAVINPNLPVMMGKTIEQKFSSYYDLTEGERYLYLSWLANMTPTEELSDDLLDFHLWGIQIRLFLDSNTTLLDRENLINYLLVIRSELSAKSSIVWHINNIIDTVITIFFANEENIIALSEIHLRMYEQMLISQNPEIDAKKAFEIFTLVYPNCFSEQLLPYIQIYFDKKFKTRQLKHYKSYFRDIKIPSNYSAHFVPDQLNYWYPCCYTPIIREQSDKISDFFNKLIDDFRKYEKITNDAISISSPLAYFSLPKCVQGKECLNELQLELKNLVSKQEVVVSYNSLSELWGINSTVKSISKSHIDSIITGLGKLGYGIIPNYSINNKRISTKGVCVIYKQAKKVKIKTDSNFHDMELLAKLIVLVMQVDSIVDSDLELVRTMLAKINKNEQNLAYLNAYILWLLQDKQYLDNTAKDRIKSLSVSKKNSFLHTLQRLTYTNKNVNYNRVESFKRLLPYFDKENISTHILIHRMITSDDDLYVSSAKQGGVKIDTKKLNKYKQLTEGSQLMLSEIFNEEDNTEEVAHNEDNNVIKEMLSLLFTKDVWDKKELEVICKDRGLMLGSILEEINDYSYSVVDDVALEDEGDTINIIMDYKEELL